MAAVAIASHKRKPDAMESAAKQTKVDVDAYPANLKRSFCFWTPKGGTGKTTLSVQAACSIATRFHPAVNVSPLSVLFVDMSPQADATRLLLGNSDAGIGRARKLAREGRLPKTTGGFLGSQFINASANLNVANFLEKPSDTNAALHFIHKGQQQLLDNILLLAGDLYLEAAAPMLTREADLMRGLGHSESNWFRVMHLLRRGIANYIRTLNARDYVVIIDTSPCFSIYTQIALTAADRLICPVQMDAHEGRNVDQAVTLLYGETIPNAYADWESCLFSTRADKERLPRPKIDRVIRIQGRSTDEKQDLICEKTYCAVKSACMRPGGVLYPKGCHEVISDIVFRKYYLLDVPHIAAMQAGPIIYSATAMSDSKDADAVVSDAEYLDMTFGMRLMDDS